MAIESHQYMGGDRLVPKQPAFFLSNPTYRMLELTGNMKPFIGRTSCSDSLRPSPEKVSVVELHLS